MNIVKYLLKLLYKTETKDANAKMIAKHLAQNYLYDRKGIDALYPDVKDRVKLLVKRMKELKMPVKVHESFRSAKKQNKYYAQGRTTSGEIITHVKGLDSWHQYGLAVDIIFVKYNWSPPNESWWETLGREGKSLGLEWGGDWTSFKDRPHFQWTANGTIKREELKNYLYVG